MKINARNQIKGTVTEIREGVVEAQVTMEICGGQTMVSVKRLGMKVSSEAFAVVNGVSVMLAVE